MTSESSATPNVAENLVDSEQEFSDKVVGTGERKRRTIFRCPHTNLKHYAKNMCHNCYHRRGKTKKAWACPHTHKSHYSGGMCQNCYLAKYYIKRKSKIEQKEANKQKQDTADQSVDETKINSDSV